MGPSFGLRLSLSRIEGRERLDLLVTKSLGHRYHSGILADAVPILLEGEDDVVVGQVIKGWNPPPFATVTGDAGARQVLPVRRITFRLGDLRGYKSRREDREEGGDRR
jgi:hypothetical protein